MKLGLKRGTVELHDHDCGWLMVFTKEKKEIETALGNHCVSIEHVGSSAVTGLKSKPILDIAVAVSSIANIGDILDKMKSTDYLYRGNRDENGGHLFVKGDKETRSIHLHLLSISDPQWQRYLEFRNILRESEKKRNEYEQLKVYLADRYADDRARYTAGKNDFIERTLAENQG